MAIDPAQLALNATQFIPIPEVIVPVVSGLQSAIAVTQWLVGSLFGLYFIFYVMNWWHGRVQTRLLREIRDDLDLLNLHFKTRGFVRHAPFIPRKRWERVMARMFEGKESYESKRRK